MSDTQQTQDELLLLADLSQALQTTAITFVVGTLAHKFNNYLSVIQCQADLLKESIPADEEIRAAFATIERAIREARENNRQMMTPLPRSGPGKEIIELRSAVIAMRALLEELLSEDIELEFDFMVGEPLWIALPPGLLQQLLLELSRHAHQAMPQGGKLSIVVRMQEPGASARKGMVGEVQPPSPTTLSARSLANESSMAVLEIADTGEALSPLQLEMTFEPHLLQTEGVSQRGLGLAMIKKLVERYAGRCHLISQPGQGTSLSLSFPMVTPDEKQAFFDTAEDLLHGNGERIFVAEGNAYVRKHLSTSLVTLGYQIRQAENIHGLLAACGPDEEVVDLFVVDADLPELSIGDCLRAIRQRKEQTPIIILYSTEIGIDQIPLDDSMLLLQKPIMVTELGVHLKKMLKRDGKE